MQHVQLAMYRALLSDLPEVDQSAVLGGTILRTCGL